MLSTPSGDVLRNLQVLFQDGTGGDLTDGELLDRFTCHRDETAFSILVERHGAMVLRVCRAVLADEHDAHDAFQATFLVLVRRAHLIDRFVSVGPWLFGVCHRIAIRARADAVRRRVRERRSAEMRARESERPDQPGPESWPELYAELARLPEKYRAPLVLCYLEGQTTEEAAGRLGCPRGTILSRLARARERLRGRLARHGLALPAIAISSSLPPSKWASGGVPASLVEATVRAAVRLGTDGIAAGTIPAAVTQLMKGTADPMKLTQLKIAVSTLLAVGMATGAVVLAQRTPSSEQAPAVRGQLPLPDNDRIELFRRRLAQTQYFQNNPGQLPSLTAGHSEDADESDSPGTALIPRTVHGRTLKADTAVPICVRFSPDGKILAWGQADRTVKFLNPITGKERASFRVTPRQGQHAAIMELAFSHDNALLAMACDDMTIRLRDVASGEERITIPQNCFANTVAFAPDGQTLAWAGTNAAKSPDPIAGAWSVLTLWDVASRKVKTTFSGHTGGISSLAFSADGTMIVSGSYDKTVKLWQAASGKELATLNAPEEIHSVAISPEGRFIVAATGDESGRIQHFPPKPGFVLVWNVDTRMELAALPAHEGSVRAVAFSPDGKIFASAGRDGLVKVWNTQTRKLRAVLQGHGGYIYSLAFTPDSKTLASSGIDSRIRLWNVKDLLAPHIELGESAK
jgi:RNA polymerase sigma factor (sigma-70 family)